MRVGICTAALFRIAARLREVNEQVCSCYARGLESGEASRSLLPVWLKTDRAGMNAYDDTRSGRQPDRRQVRHCLLCRKFKYLRPGFPLRKTPWGRNKVQRLRRFLTIFLTIHGGGSPSRMH